MKLLRSTLGFLTLTSLLVGSSQAGIIVVDDDGGVGVDFTDIQSAINSATHGDILIVHPGNYAGFVLDLGLTILGSEASDTTVITSQVTISGVPNPRRAVLTGLRMQTLAVTGNPGHVVLDSLKVLPYSANVAALSNNDCADVRMYQCTVTAPTSLFVSPSPNAVQVVDSRFEAVGCVFRGAAGYDVSCYDDGGDGGDALWGSSSSFLGIFQTSCYGGRGGDTDYFCEWSDAYGGDGGDGLYLRGGSLAVLAGLSTDRIEHGREGYGDTFPVFHDGTPGKGLRVNGASYVRASGETITTSASDGTSTIHFASPSDPFLERFGTLQAGRQQTFWVYGNPGDAVTFYLGRAPTIVVDPLQEMDDMVSHERAYNLGTIPATGRKKFLFTIPTWFPTAFHFFVQAATTDSLGQRRLTNSMPIVLRELP